MSKLKIAVDNQISYQTIDALSADYDVVFNATDEPDEQWIETALDLGAQVFISPDLDISMYLIDNGYDWIKWIDVPQGLRGNKQVNYLMKELKKVSNEPA